MSMKSESKSAKQPKAKDTETEVIDSVGTHPLETPWTFFFGKKAAKGTDYTDFQKSLARLGTFSTVEGFWRHYAHLQGAESLPRDHDLFLFRHKLVPAWETFPNGGCWIIKVRKRNGTIGRLWEELVAAVVGEEFKEPDVVGVVLSTRVKEDLISIWNKGNQDCIFAIGEKLKTILNLDDGVQPSYKYFKNSVADGSSYRHATAYAYAATAVSVPPAATAAAALPAAAAAPSAPAAPSTSANAFIATAASGTPASPSFTALGIASGAPVAAT